MRDGRERAIDESTAEAPGRRWVMIGAAEILGVTPDQAALIRKYTKNVFLLYDSDQAGLKATFKSGDALLSHGIAVRVISLPEGEDPDTFVSKAGVDGFERAARESVDVFDRKIQILDRGGWFSDLRRKRAALAVAEDASSPRTRSEKPGVRPMT